MLSFYLVFTAIFCRNTKRSEMSLGQDETPAFSSSNAQTTTSKPTRPLLSVSASHQESVSVSQVCLLSVVRRKKGHMRSRSIKWSHSSLNIHVHIRACIVNMTYDILHFLIAEHFDLCNSNARICVGCAFRVLFAWTNESTVVVCHIIVGRFVTSSYHHHFTYNHHHRSFYL